MPPALVPTLPRPRWRSARRERRCTPTFCGGGGVEVGQGDPGRTTATWLSASISRIWFIRSNEMSRTVRAGPRVPPTGRFPSRGRSPASAPGSRRPTAPQPLGGLAAGTQSVGPPVPRPAPRRADSRARSARRSAAGTSPDDVRELPCGVGVGLLRACPHLGSRAAKRPIRGQDRVFYREACIRGAPGSNGRCVAGAGDRETAIGTSSRPNRSTRPITSRHSGNCDFSDGWKPSASFHAAWV